MYDIIKIFLLIVLVNIIYNKFFENKRENYVTTIVGYNNIVIPTYYIPSIFESETKELIKIFDKQFKDNDLQITEYKEHNPYIPFPLENPIKKFIIDYLKTNVDKFKGHKLEITSDLNKLYYKDNGNDRLFIFNINLVDNTKFLVRNLKVKINIKNISRFIKDKTDYNLNDLINIIEVEINYRTNIPAQTIINSIELLSIRLDKNNYARFELLGIDNLRPNYYQIKNKLGLMDPFITSGRDMIINEEMKQKFIDVLKEKEKLI